MRAADLEKFIARAAHTSPSELDQRTRWLRNLDVAVLGGFRAGRGRHAPQLNAWETAFMLLCLAARRPKDAKPVALWLCEHKTRLPRHSGKSSDLMECIARVTGRDPQQIDFGYILGVVIAQAASGKHFDIRSIELSDTGAFAWVMFSDGVRLLFTDREFQSQIALENNEEVPSDEKWPRGWIDRRIILGAEFLEELSKQLGYASDADLPPLHIEQTAGEAE